VAESSVTAKDFYKHCEGCRSGAVFQDAAAAGHYYRRYVGFVADHVARGSSVLELGSATGTGAACLSISGFTTTATDVCHEFFRRDLRSGSTRFTGADTLCLPFADGAFDAVCSYQVLEHIPEPAKALDEMIRVVRPGGCVCIAGPNLIGLTPSVYALVAVLPRVRPISRWFFRDAGAVDYPFGTTVPQICAILVKNIFRTVWKLFHATPEFLMRAPDFRDSMHADADSCYLLNPIDLIRYFRQRGLHIEARRGRGPFAFLGPLAGGTWVAARKPPGQ
jgi:SAM-dependent methyltransferase